MSRPLALFANAAVDAEVEIVVNSSRALDHEAVSILFGNEQALLEFYDVESLERLRDVADEGARRRLRHKTRHLSSLVVEDDSQN